MIISLNGSLCDEKEAMISAYDHGFLYGLGLFETFRTYQGKAFLLLEHLERLTQGCNGLAIQFRNDHTYWERQIKQLLTSNHLYDGYFRLSVSAGTDILGLSAKPYLKPTLVLYVKALPEMDKSLYEQGKPLQLLRLRRNSPEGAWRLKSFHYMNNIMAKQELAKYPWAQGAEGLFLNEAGAIAEGIVSNVFFIKQGKCYTPQVNTGILPGITRQRVIELAEQLSIPLEEGIYGWEELACAEEIFLTNSIQELVPIHTLFDLEGNPQQIGKGRIGTITQKLLQYYREGGSR
ncbi:MAG: aminodeoxychorismate lyase [Paenibacillaceae bacterium]